MKIKNIMTTAVRTCSPGTNLAAAAALMLDGDAAFSCRRRGKLVGVVTDRDMYIALATRNRLASQINVGDVARKQVWTCGPDDEVQTALERMKEHHVRRLPVEGFGGHSHGDHRSTTLSSQPGPGNRCVRTRLSRRSRGFVPITIRLRTERRRDVAVVNSVGTPCPSTVAAYGRARSCRCPPFLQGVWAGGLRRRPWASVRRAVPGRTLFLNSGSRSHSAALDSHVRPGCSWPPSLRSCSASSSDRACHECGSAWLHGHVRPQVEGVLLEKKGKALVNDGVTIAKECALEALSRVAQDTL